jgi:hypothetical protein
MRPVANFEEELPNGNGVYQKSMSLAPGTYRLRILVRDTVTGAQGVQNMPLVVN